MDWTLRPTRTAMYSVTESHGSDSYIPGTVVTLKLEVLPAPPVLPLLRLASLRRCIATPGSAALGRD